MPVLRSSVVVLLCWCLLAGSARADHPIVGFGQGTAGPILTIPAPTLSKGQWAASARFEYIDFDAFPVYEITPGDGDVHSIANVMSPSLSIAYGFSDAFTLGVRLPAIIRHDIREAHAEPGGAVEIHAHGTSSGVGDMPLLAQIRIWNRAPLMIAMLTGVKVPTGQTHVKDKDGERFEAEHQPGSGSWDFLEGIALSRRTTFGSVDGNLLASFATEGALDTNLGNLFQYNAAVCWVLLGEKPVPDEHQAHRHTGGYGADVVAEVNGETRSRIKTGGEDDPNSGGTLIYISPGFRFGPPHGWSGSVSVGFPFVQDLHGKQHENGVRIVAGVATAF